MSEDSRHCFENLGTFTVSPGKTTAASSTFLAIPSSWRSSRAVPPVGTGALLGLLDGTIKAGRRDRLQRRSRYQTIGDVSYALTNLASGNVMSLANLAIGESYSKALDGNITHTHPGTTGDDGDETDPGTTGDDGGATAVPEPASSGGRINYAA